MYIYVGKIVNTHGIKGEVRILSDINDKKMVFLPGNHIYIGKEKKRKTIQTYRVHKQFDMVTFIGIENINEVLLYKGEDIYIKKEEVQINGYFDEELIGLEVYTEKPIGKVIAIRKGYQDLLVIEGKQQYLVPKIDPFIKKVDIPHQKLYINSIEGLIDEN